MNAFAERCIALRKQGYTLSEITAATGRPKTSVYTHIRNIPLSEAKQKLIKIESRRRVLELARSRKGKSLKSFREFIEWDRNTVSLIAHLTFDGSITKTSCVYNNRNICLVDNVEKCMRVVYDYEPKRYLNKSTGVSRIGYYNVSLSSYLKIKADKLKEEICDFPKPLKQEFLKAFFDDEGCMDYRPERSQRKVRGYQKNMAILILIQKLLSDLDISSRVIEPNEVVISGKENLVKFSNSINFTPGVKVNGNRTNSLWKKSLQKRVLLSRAISSFSS